MTSTTATATATATTATPNTNNNVIAEIRIPIIEIVSTTTDATTTTTNRYHVTSVSRIVVRFYKKLLTLLDVLQEAPTRVLSNQIDTLQQQQLQQEPSPHAIASPLLRDTVYDMLLAHIHSYQYNEFCQSMNRYIQIYDQLSCQRKRILAYEKIILFMTFYIYLHFVFVPQMMKDEFSTDTIMRFAVRVWLSMFLVGIVFGIILSLTLKCYIQPIVVQQNDIGHQVNDTCSKMSQYMTATFVSASITTITTDTSIPKNLTVAITLESIPHIDTKGSFVVMDHLRIQCTQLPLQQPDEGEEVTSVDRLLLLSGEHQEAVATNSPTTTTHTRSGIDITDIIRRDESIPNTNSNDDDQNSYRLLNHSIIENYNSFEVV